MLIPDPDFVFIASLEAAGLKFNLLCLVKLSKWTVHNTVTYPTPTSTFFSHLGASPTASPLPHHGHTFLQALIIFVSISTSSRLAHMFLVPPSQLSPEWYL